MKILNLISENVMRLHAVDITPQGDIVEVSGANANGKSSILNSIWFALAGTSNIPIEPIRKGAESARIRVDLGEIIVTRTFKRQGEDKFTTNVKVESAEGASYKSPQSMLDALFSGLTFDPLEFSRMKAKDQFDMLRAFVPDVDFKAIEDMNRGDFEKRAEANRRMADAKAAAGLIVIPTDLPDDEADESALLDQMTSAAQHNLNIERENERRVNCAKGAETYRETAVKKRSEAATHRKLADDREAEAVELERKADEDIASLASAGSLPKPIDVAQVRTQHAQAQAVNQRIRAAAENRRKKTALEKVASDAALASDEFTAKINARNKAKQEAIAAAKMPVEGLGFGDGFITLNGVPFDQGSDAERLRTSCAIAMKANSKLKVIRVRDGSLLDDQSMALLAEVAAENGVQIWIETVRAVTNAAIIIEDGRVKGAQAEQEDAA